MQDCATQPMRVDTQTAIALEAAFDGGRLTSDGGLVWLSEMDEELGLCERISEHVPEWRKRKGRHSLASLIKQRVFQIACGYGAQTTPTPSARPPAQDGLRFSARGRCRSGQPAHHLPPGERREHALVLPNSRNPLRPLPEPTGEGRRSAAGASGFRLDGQPHPRRAGRELSPTAPTDSTSTIRCSSSTATAGT